MSKIADFKAFMSKKVSKDHLLPVCVVMLFIALAVTLVIDIGIRLALGTVM